MRRKLLSILALLLIAAGSAWADSESIWTNTKQSSYTNGNITIAVDDEGDGDGAYVNTDKMVISTSDGGNITQVVLRIGFYAGDAGNVTANHGSCEVSGTGNNKETYVTITSINAPSVTVTSEETVQVDHVDVTYSPFIAVTGVSLSQSEAVLTVGGTQTLTATVAPANATNKSVTWTTSNAAVATVANGVVTAVGVGSATITATTTDGAKTASCAVTVANPIAAASADGTIGAFTDANGQTRLGIVVTLNGNKYAISMNEETDLSGLSGTYTKKVGSHTYYNQADACQKFANNKTDGTYNVANVWRLPTTTEMSYLVDLGGSAWDGTEGHQGYTWTIGSNSLFLPAAGYYDNGGVASSDWGYYWTSGGGTGNMLCFTSWYTARIGSGGTTSGMPLRLFCQLCALLYHSRRSQLIGKHHDKKNQKNNIQQ